MKSNNNNKEVLDVLSMPAQALDLEDAVLGALMIDKEAIVVVSNILTVDCFYLPENQAIYRAISSLYSENRPIDILTVVDQLKRMNLLETAGGLTRVVSLTNKVASAANLEYHAKIVFQKYIRRAVFQVSQELIKDCQNPVLDEFDILDSAGAKIFDITGGLHGQTIITADAVTNKLLESYKHVLSLSEDETVGVPTGLDIDKVLNGLRAPDLIIIAARPSMGKSALITTLARQQAVFRNIPVGVFSLEMSPEQQQQRIAAAEANLPNSLLREPRKMTDFQKQLYLTALSKISNSPILYCDIPDISIQQLRAKAREMVRKHGVQIIYVDYLQLMSSRSKSVREQEISEISRGLKSLAKELNIPIVALSQLSRAVENRGGSKRPILSDLRESGSIEQDADIVAFLHRPEYYGILQDEDGNSTEGLCEFIIAKHRNGAVKTVLLNFNASRVLFENRRSDDFYERLQRNFKTDILIDDKCRAVEEGELPF